MSLVKKVSAAFGHPKSNTLPKIFSKMSRKVELRILTSLPVTPTKIAGKLGKNENKILTALQKLCMQGAVVISDFKKEKPIYSIPSDAGLCIDLILWDRRYRSDQKLLDLSDRLHNEEYIRTHDNKEQRVFPVTPIEKKIQAPSSVSLPYEGISEIAEDARRIVVQHCPCRTRARRYGKTQEICLSLDDVADYLLSRKIGRGTTKEKALALLDQAEDLGRVLQNSNTSKADVVYNCCTYCCSLLSARVHLNKNGRNPESPQGGCEP